MDKWNLMYAIPSTNGNYLVNTKRLTQTQVNAIRTRGEERNKLK